MRTDTRRAAVRSSFRQAIILSLFACTAMSVLAQVPITSIPGSAFRFNNGGSNSNVALVSPNSQYVFVTNQFSSSISVLNMAGDGTLTTNSIWPSSLFSPVGMAVNPTGDHLYVTGNAQANVVVYSVAANGALAQVQSVPLPAGASPLAGIVYVHQAGGDFVYVNNSTNTVTEFKVDPGGTLTHITDVNTGGVATGIGYYGSPRITACPGHLFVLTDATGNVAAFNIQADGSLVAAPGSPFPLPGTSSGSIAASPIGDAMYAGIGDGIAKYNIAVNGSLVLVGTAPTGMFGAGIDGLIVDNAGAYVIAVDPGAGSNGMTAVLDATTGFPVLGSPVVSDATPNAVAAGAAFDPNFKYFLTGNANFGATEVSVYTWNLGKPVRLIINPSKVNAGDPSTGTVKLLKPAPVGGAQIALSASDPTAVTIPPFIVIPEGQKQGTFTIDTDPTIQVPTPVDITATYGPDSDTAILTIVPLIAAIQLQSQYFPFPWLLTHAEVGGPAVAARVVLSLPAADPDGVVVTLTSQFPGTVSVTKSVTVQAGQTITYFPLFTTPVAFDTDVIITGSSAGSSQFAIDTVLAPTPMSVQISPTTVPGGTSAVGTVFLNGVAPSSGLPVSLSSNQVPFVTVNPVVFIQPGKTYGSFPINTTAVPNNITATITATYNGVSASGTLKVIGAGLAAFIINPNTVPGGTSTSGILSLQKPAPAGGSDVDLAFNPPGPNYPASFPASVHINAGLTQGIFTINTAPTGVTTLVPIKATLRGTASSITTSLTVQSSGISSITVTPTVMHAGTTTMAGYVFLSGVAPPGGANVTLGVFGGGSTSPTVVNIPAGQNRGQFSFTAPSPVPPQGITVTVSGTYPVGVTKFCQVRVIP